MNKKNNLLKAAIIIAIALIMVLPGAAMATESNNQQVKKSPYAQLNRDSGWVEQASGFWEASRGVNYIHAVDENIVWASGYDGSGSNLPVQEFTRTVNGGELWEADTIGGTAPSDGDIAMICAIDEYTAWVPIHSGAIQGIWKTSDGGVNWVHQDTALYSGSGSFPNVVHFWNENDGWCQGDPVDGYFEMYTTTDGGDTWTRVPSEDIPAPNTGEYGTVGYYDVLGDTVWFGTQCSTNPGRVFKSTDKGYTWTVADTPFPSSGWVDVRMKDDMNGLAMDKRSGGSLLAETSDGGETWTSITPTGYFFDYDIAYIPGTENMWITTGAATGDSGASYSLDGGYTWVNYDEVSGVQLLDCDFIEGGIGWAGSFCVDEYTGGMYKYTPSEEPDLGCTGSLDWAEVKPGETVTGSFTIQNLGGPTSLLDWEISEYPEWGTFTFNPDSGTDVAPGDIITVEVEVIAPPEKETDFDGEIIIANSENPDDTCTIDVSLATPYIQQSLLIQFITRITQRFPNAFPILRNILGL